MSLFAGLILATTPLSPAQEPAARPAVDEVLATMERAFGEPARLAARRSLVTRGRATLAGADEVRGFFSEAYAGLRRARTKTEFPIFGSYEDGCDGEVVWEKNPLEVNVYTGWLASQQLRLYGILQHVPWREMYAEARMVGAAEVDGQPCFELELVPRLLEPDAASKKELPWPDRWYVDRETHLPRRIVSKSIGLLDEPDLMRLDLDDWREVDGVRYAHRVELELSGIPIRFDYESFEHDVALPEGFFELDDDVRRARAEREGSIGALEIRIEELERRPIASIRLTCDAQDLRRVLAVILPETLRYVTSVGAAASGPPFVRYHQRGEELDVEGGVPLSDPVPGAGRVEPGTLPAGRAAVAWHVGAYERLGETHRALAAWLAENGLEAGGAPWEEYWTDARLEPDPSKWRTKLVQPLGERRAVR